ncbi:D-Ala-D-Ala carboxypeptidase family metallohydrolase [Phaeodactylibacter xiamenensis]|uniref:D-Ala-D-Ala carboxypeptidase family metallohydrolase n=1 Tax=Phaeodactylibacter xiamenensis TaxID=1524460 RepID=UPI0024A963D6|nr:D-Ala-D-Ala carboxypeptidase family metallohydrolase [Phaeodactylibacter xiamenensis]
MSNIQTYLPQAAAETTSYAMVSSSSQMLRENFTVGEFYNPKTGLPAHPLAIKVIDAVQYLRTRFGMPIRITSTYRNYIPSGPGVVGAATHSPHMLAQAIDFQFIGSKREVNTIYIELRDDFDNKGPVFQELWEMGIRGFGSYDTFLHLDCVQSELYPVFASKRTRRYQGQLYSRWNSMKTLRNLNLSPTNVVLDTILVTAGEIRGMFAELGNAEDRGKDIQSRHIRTIALVIGALTTVGYLSYRYFGLFESN